MNGEVVAAVTKFLSDNDGHINSYLPTSQTLKKVYDYETLVVPAGNYPCIMVGGIRSQKTWVAAPYIIEIRYELDLMGYLIHKDSSDNANYMRHFADGVSNLFETHQGETLIVPGKDYYIHYHSEVPLDQMEIDYAFIGDAFCREWRATWHGYITRQTFGVPTGEE